MTPLGDRAGPDWLGLCRQAGAAARAAVAGQTGPQARGVELGRGEGGDMTLAVDRAAEDAIFAELEAAGEPLTAISEERGEVQLGEGGPPFVVIDPVDGTVNAKRGLPHASVSIAVADGPSMEHLLAGYVGELDSSREWWAVRGEGAFEEGRRLPRLDAGPLEIVAIETSRPGLVAGAAPAFASLDARRIRAFGSVAATLCLLAAGRLDGMVSLRQVRSVDVAAGWLAVREVGGEVLLPEARYPAALTLDMRSRVVAGRDMASARAVAEAFGTGLPR